MYVIADEMFELISGGAPTASAPATGGSNATSGTSAANCPAGTIPIAASGNINATIAGVTVGGSGGFATCIPFTSPGTSSGGTGGSADSTLKNVKKVATEKDKD